MMRKTLAIASLFGLQLVALMFPSHLLAVDRSAAGEEFFEREIRPLLLAHCVECHGAKKQEAGLRLDFKAAALRGGDEGKVIHPGRPSESRLIRAVRYQGDIEMPPEEQLPHDKIDLLTRWIAAGAPWPDDSAKAAVSPTEPAAIAAARQEHWAFRPVAMPTIPSAAADAWVTNPIDAFVLARLRSEGLEPSAAATGRTLLRRVYFDVTGLPPSYDETVRFEADESGSADESGTAYEEVVAALLGSTAYGERWGRHWLDVARYADTQGYQAGGRSQLYPYAYTYRDYVIDALNDDLPYDEFILDQLAADQRSTPRHPGALAAMGFLTVGRRFNNSMPDILDDRIDVVGRGLLGLTIACARCHDHKFEPITSEDYYSLYGIFYSSEEPADLPLIADPASIDGHAKFQAEHDRRAKAAEKFRDACHQLLLKAARSQVGDYLLAVVQHAQADRLSAETELMLKAKTIKPRITRRWAGHLRRTQGGIDPVFHVWNLLAKLPADGFVAGLPGVIEAIKRIPAGVKIKKTNPIVKRAFLAKRPASLVAAAEMYGEIFSAIDSQWTEAHQANPKLESLPDPAQEQLRQLLYGEKAPLGLNETEIVPSLDQEMRDKYRGLLAAVKEWEASSPLAPPRAMVMVDRASPVDMPIFLRGDPARRGPLAPRRFLTILDSADRRRFEGGSGRLALARSIASRDNPLTARVIVNRVWQHYFGAGLVRSASNLGMYGEPPSHPELLDYLAARFMDEGWSLKKLHRWILLSSTYRQQSEIRPDCQTRDPENRLLWRMQRKRLEFEPFRDSLLVYAGRLDPTAGGQAVDLQSQPFSRRRTVYGKIDRQRLWATLRVFDVANPEASSAGRSETTVPQQALYLLNSDFVLEQARHVAARSETALATGLAAHGDLGERIKRLWRVVLQRDPDDDEQSAAEAFLQRAQTEASDKVAPFERLAHVLLATNEVMFID